MQTSFPVEQPQPNQEFYGLDVLPLIQTHSRADYEAAGGPLVPFDPTRPEQNWWDDTYASHAPDDSVTFSVVNYAGDGTATMGTLTQKAAWMAAPNFKGLPNYPKWTPAPTVATRGGIAQYPEMMSTEQQARELMTELGGTSIADAGLSTLVVQGVMLLQATQYSPDDPRRLWSITMPNGTNINVGWKLASKYSAGVGHPGHWVATALVEGGIDWQSDPVPDGTSSTTPALPPPCRPLKANEKLEIFMATTFFKATRIRRMDLATAPAAGTTVSSTEAADIADMKTKITALYNLLIPHS